MKMKSLALTAVSGMLVGALAACGGDKPATPDPNTAATPAGGDSKASCSGKGAAPAGSGDSKASCSGKGAAPASSAAPK